VDITARKEVEKSLRESEERFRAIVSQTTAGIGHSDLSGRLTFANERLAGLLGYPLEELSGRSISELTHEENVPEKMRLIERTITRGVPFQFERRLVHKDGSAIWVNASISPVRDAEGRVTSAVAAFIDVTPHKEMQEALLASEERLRLVLESAREYAIFATDLELRVTSWNHGAERLLGYRETEILGQNAEVIFTPGDREAEAPAAEMRQALAEGRATDERWHLRKDGSRFWGNGFLMTMHDNAGQTIGFVKILRDQTEDRETQRALEKNREDLLKALEEMEGAREQAEAAARAKDQFLAVLSHELRTPLTPVLMAAHTLARRTDLPPAVQEALAMIRRNVQMEARFIDDLLDLTRIEHGKIEILHEEVDVHEAIRHAVEISAPDMEAKGQRFEMALDAARHTLRGDMNRLQQVFWNLLKNGSKFTPRAGVIRLRSYEESGRILVVIADGGIGMEQAALQKIFHPFEQADESIARIFGGLGLGLAIARATVEAHGGQISAASAGRDQGATFTVSLPLG
jgi:two-component system, chemotaxis family, CheB/CheR fusion protein